jgi:hypothetical protein
MGSSKTANTERQQSGQTRPLSKRVLPFVGLLLMPPVALVAGALLRFAVKDSPAGLAVTAALLAVASYALAHFAYNLAGTRKRLIQLHLTVTVGLTGASEALTVAIGFPRWWVTTFLVGGLFLAASWCLYRVDVLRQRADQPENEDSLKKELGLEGTKFARPVHHFDSKGDLTRIEVPAKHAPGKTVEVLQGAVPAIESVAGAPRGRSRAVPDPENAGRSNLVIITKDVLATTVPWPGPSAPGTCITEHPLISGVHEDQQPLTKFIAGDHPLAPNPSSYAYMGMTRTGKTLNAQVNALEMFTRRNVVLFWFDTIKGSQTIAPIRDGLDIVVGDDDPAAFKQGMKALINAVKWRANELGRHGFRAWNQKAAEQLGMPLLVPHFEEADALCDLAPDQMVFLASKGLSTGIVSGISLQRADATSMPTGLRFNIGNWTCFGCGDPYSAGFALSDHTIAAGAHPENWKQSKPGYCYHEGIGVPEDRWPVTARSFFADDDEMREHTEMWAPHMTPLDAGTIGALGDWYPAAKQKMVAADTPVIVDRQERITVVTSANSNGRSGFVAADTTTDEDPEALEAHAEIRDQMSEMADQIEPQLDPEAERIDPQKAVPPPAAGDEMSWGDDKASAPTPEAAAEAFDQALREIAEDPSLRDPENPDTVLFQVGTLVDRYKFRSRPWFSGRLTDAAEGKVTVPPGLALSRALDKSAGYYRIRRLAVVAAIGHAG